MKELVETLVKALVRNPDAVTVTVIQKGSLEIYQVRVAPEDMGKVIGRKGRIANAIRTVVKAGALRENRKVAVDIM
ncbi:KH domain-containing protein [Dialister sp.]|uniref:KH domain-containing protein n=1 Tax=Dialister sp. TaxID=1955814 RepID=UPI002E815CE5|nr:KH domain-containing protein [Dialister sp.]MEE3452434.1 KH domain-containing protein [Dialister sp.]